MLALPGVSASTNSDLMYLPPDPLLVQDLKSAIPWIDLTPKAYNWYTCVEAANQQAAQVATTTRQQRPNGSASSSKSGLTVRPYQQSGAEWLRLVERGILGDDPGLGKTVQALLAAKDAQRVLIVVPNTVKEHWHRHALQWTDHTAEEIGVCLGNHAQRQAIIDSGCPWLIVNHEMLRPTGTTAFKRLLTKTWDAVIIDEAHKFQGRDSQQSKGARALHTHALYLLTGTPVWNRPDSLWHLLHLLDSRRFGSYWRWVDEYCEQEVTPLYTAVVGVKTAKLPRLHTVLAPLLLRRRKEDVLPELPPKILTTLDYDISQAQRKQYTEMKRHLRRLAEDQTIAQVYPNAMVVVNDLRLLLDSPTLLGYDTGWKNPKDEVIDDLLDSLLSEGRKVVVFCWYKAYVQYLATRHSKRGISTTFVTGDTPHRDEVIQTFCKDPGRELFIGTMGACATGVDGLQVATAAIFAEGSYSPAVNMQAEGRLDRIGQKTSPLMYRLSANRTVEEAIWQTTDDYADTTDDMLAFNLVFQKLLRQGD